jgi:hypothetical protein
MRPTEFERLGEWAEACMGQTSGKVCDCRRAIVREGAVPQDGIRAHDEGQEYYGVRRGLGKVNLEIFYRVSADR